MTLSPLYSVSHVFKSSVAKSQTAASHKIQLYLDYDCPFSAKIFKKIYNEVIPALDKKHPGKFEFTFMNVVQPWHPTSTLMHEVGLAVAKLQPQSFWEFSNIVFLNQTQFFDSETYKQTREETYSKLIKLAVDNFDIKSEDIWNLVRISPSSEPSNAGNKIGKDLKYFIRYQRTVGVHVTPTIFVNGIINGSVESSNSVDSIIETLESYL